jgi:UDP-N-acetylmuramoyl-tripeptide--D-alanyl-D-alanine ligase
MAEIVATATASGAAIVRVADTTRAIQDLARHHRSRLRCAVVGVTGSSGKTTTKDMLSAVLGTSLRVVATDANRNNELGVPLTVFAADAETDVLVVEMGMRGEGQIAELCSVARPTIGLITNVGVSHIELLGSQDAIARAKGEIVACLPAEGTAVLNGDDTYSSTIAAGSPAPVLRYGLSEDCDVRATDIELDESGRARFTLVGSAGSTTVALSAPGRHNVYNALAAAAVGGLLGVSAEDIARGLGSAQFTAMRMQVFTTPDGITVVNDAYNANPASMRAALDTLEALVVEGRHIAVLGDMAELGSLTELAHFELGESVARHDVDLLFAVGPRASRIAEGARAEGMAAEAVLHDDDAEVVAAAVYRALAPGDAVLVKASRVMGLESVVQRIVEG